ncbi:MAG: hypothetical protein JHC81_07755 [Brevundimonas sp.]|uniref:hypothetical protein n=1 Tax=Brevundimonas sp. TaxID=1871086 RepID=UPI001A2D947F|nr:hypothetical protein [Brevundimonas sp.]MBJ7447414.1 hypothetical protein [Brevundimonas sp.]
MKPENRPERRFGMATAVVLGSLLLGATTPAAAAECRIRFTDFVIEPYQSGGQQMQRLVLVGDHNYSSATNTGGAGRTEFRVADGDGFLIFSLLSLRWQTGLSSGAETGRVSRAEVRTLQQAMEMGRAYYARLIEIISAEPRPSNYESMRGRTDIKNEVIAETLTVLAQGRSYRANNDTIVIDTGRIRTIAARFRPGGDMMSQYRDFRVRDGAPNLLCDPDAASVLIGRLACGDISIASARPPCPDGLVIDPIVWPAIG